MGSKANQVRFGAVGGERCGDFDALFVQLDRPDACAPMTEGMRRLTGMIVTLREARSNQR